MDLAIRETQLPTCEWLGQYYNTPTHDVKPCRGFRVLSDSPLLVRMGPLGGLLHPVLPFTSRASEVPLVLLTSPHGLVQYLLSSLPDSQSPWVCNQMLQVSCLCSRSPLYRVSWIHNGPAAQGMRRSERRNPGKHGELMASLAY